MLKRHEGAVADILQTMRLVSLTTMALAEGPCFSVGKSDELLVGIVKSSKLKQLKRVECTWLLKSNIYLAVSR